MTANSSIRNPRGGLTESGRRYFQQKEGAHLKAGVKKRQRDMTPAELKRKGSWAVRFYGRSGELPPLRKPSGEPTRFALTAAAWGEPVPKTVTAARRIAAKGHRLLAAYQKTQGTTQVGKRKTKAVRKTKTVGKTKAYRRTKKAVR
jgi:Domain of unknown function (DUF6321)